MQQTLYRVHLSIVDVIFRSQFTLPLKLTPLQRTHPITSRQIFLVRNLYTYYFKQSFIVSLKFFSIIFILFFSQFNDISFSILTIEKNPGISGTKQWAKEGIAQASQILIKLKFLKPFLTTNVCVIFIFEEPFAIFVKKLICVKCSKEF